MPSDKLRPDEIDAAIAASQQQGRRHDLRLDPGDLTPLEADYRLRVRGHADDEKEVELNNETNGSDIPTYPGRLRPDIAYSDHDGEAAENPRRRRILPMLIAGLTLVVFAGIIWWAYGTEPAGELGTAPLITAEEGAAKFRPEDEGGMEVPNQDKLIYSQIGGDSGSGPQVERLLPPPETPIEPPAPPPGSLAAGPATDAAAPAATVETMRAESAPADASTAETAPQPPAAAATPVETSALDGTPQDGASESATPVPEKPAAAKPTEPEVAPEVAKAPAEPKPEPEAGAEPAPQVAAAVTGSFRVQLAALRTRVDAQTEWDSLQRRFPTLLEELQVNLQRADLGDKGVYYRVQAGPLPDRAAARSLCDRFEEQKQACLVVAP
ncbi:SPOR domain-containing protein [Rhodospirillaceae bacterium SYSU D60014]|uniref:SPOR domain-containing protein n=1 Tax=Virgifigura deserti TaxID=2268457 RepID=UPI000E664FE4